VAEGIYEPREEGRVTCHQNYLRFEIHITYTGTPAWIYTTTYVTQTQVVRVDFFLNATRRLKILPQTKIQHGTTRQTQTDPRKTTHSVNEQDRAGTNSAIFN
jgi:hypothetical protein